MDLQKVTRYFDGLRNSEEFVETYFEDSLELLLDAVCYDEVSNEMLRSALARIGDGTLAKLTTAQVEDIKMMLKCNSVGGEIDPVIWKKCFRYWLRQDTTVKCILLVVDVQNDFISGSLALKNCPLKEDGAEIVPLINENRQYFDTVVFTKDWHPADHCSFANHCKTYCLHHSSPSLNGDIPPVMSTVIYDVKGKAIEQVLWPEHCIQGSHGAELHEDLCVEENDLVITKGTTSEVDSYSAFWDNGHLVQTNLFCQLIDNNITTVFCCGLAYDYCVGFTAQDSAVHGFKTYVIKDLCRCISEAGRKDMAEKFRQNNVIEINTRQIQEILKQT